MYGGFMEMIPFVKYQGAGNDFVMIDDREGKWSALLDTDRIARICHRRFGIGADGLILLQTGNDGADFFMKYYNSDGRTSTFCGNGGRCTVAFAAVLGVHPGKCRFLATDGWHSGEVLKDGLVQISMTDVHEVKRLDDGALVLNTGSPHYVRFVDDVQKIKVFEEGRKIRSSEMFKQNGINVNFVTLTNANEISIRTYERGVEDETYACGTGVVAAAIASSFDASENTGSRPTTYPNQGSWKVHAKGGDLRVDFTLLGPQSFHEVFLTGPAERVFEGAWILG